MNFRRIISSLRSRLPGAEPRGPLATLPLAVVIPLDGAVAEFATRVKFDILRKYGRNPGLDAFPHISLKMGFAAAEPQPFAECVDKLAGETEPFEIRLRDYGFFDEGIVFLDTVPDPRMESLRQRVLAELKGGHGVEALPIEGAGFHFHVTLAYGYRPREFAAIRADFQPRKADLKFTARHLDLFCYTGRQWVTYHRARFRDAPPS